MMIVPLAGHVLMSALLKQYQKAIFIKSILMYALIVVHAQMFALLRQYILNRIAILKTEAASFIAAFFIGGCTWIFP